MAHVRFLHILQRPQNVTAVGLAGWLKLHRKQWGKRLVSVGKPLPHDTHVHCVRTLTVHFTAVTSSDSLFFITFSYVRHRESKKRLMYYWFGLQPLKQKLPSFGILGHMSHWQRSNWSHLSLYNTVLVFPFHILTYSMVQSPSWAPNWFAASQEIPRISRNLKVHYRTHKHPPPVSILGQTSPVHIPTSHLLEIRPNIILSSTPRCPQWSLPLRFPHQDPIHFFIYIYI